MVVKEEWFIIRVMFHQGGLSQVICNWGGLPSGCCHQSGLSCVVFHWCGEWSFIRVLSSGWYQGPHWSQA